MRAVIERLTTSQTSRVRKAYREAFGEPDRARAVNAFYAEFIDLYGVSVDTLVQIINEDHRRHEAEYRALQEVREASRKEKLRDEKTFCRVCAKNLRVSVGGLPHHTDERGNSCKGVGLRGVSEQAARDKNRPKKRKKKRVISRGDSDFWYSGNSVRTVGGGLPGQGRRR
jgi:hypothetical protein